MRLHLVRHFAPLVDAGVCYGRSDLPVERAVHEAMLPGLRAVLPEGVPLYSSPLRRCAQLAHGLGEAVRYDARLAELDFGSWEMRRWDDIDRDEIDAWADDTVHYRPGGGESVLDMAMRVHDFFYTALRARPEAEAIVICHAGTMRLLAACQQGLAPIGMARQAAARAHVIGYGEVRILDCV
jgi:alpha-ribazole phosphatase